MATLVFFTGINFHKQAIKTKEKVTDIDFMKITSHSFYVSGCKKTWDKLVYVEVDTSTNL